MAIQHMHKTIVWFRNDLRIEDHPALLEASIRGEVVLLYISSHQEKVWPMGEASKWWLHQSLQSLQNQFEKHYNARLILRAGDPLKELKNVIQETGATAVYWNRRYSPEEIEQDTHIKSSLSNEGLLVKSFRGNLLFEPWTVLNKSAKPFQVFTPFWKSCLRASIPEKPLPYPQKIKAIHCKSLKLEELQLIPKIRWDVKFVKCWHPGCAEAQNSLQAFISRRGVIQYAETRDYPFLSGVSFLSPHLHFGEISPNTVWHTIANLQQCPNDGTECFLRQLGWREFAHHLLYHFPNTSLRPLRPEFETFPWKTNPEALHAWQKGMTGYPIVDAGMRQLWQTGWMHNRVRMIVGSFLVKDLMISWMEGARWFWDTLVDADLANNTLGWQWVGGCGADAAPYFRIFNPVLQGEKFDPEGEYVREWIPELKAVSNRWIHKPWEAPTSELSSSGVVLGKNYPHPIVDHSAAREEALRAFKSIRGHDE